MGSVEDEYAGPIRMRERALALDEEQVTPSLLRERAVLQQELEALRRARAAGLPLKAAIPTVRATASAVEKSGYEAVIVMDDPVRVEYVRVLTD